MAGAAVRSSEESGSPVALTYFGRTATTTRKCWRRSEPTADWTDPKIIHISIRVVRAIYQRVDTLDGIRLTYEIGPVSSKSCGFAKTQTAGSVKWPVAQSRSNRGQGRKLDVQEDYDRHCKRVAERMLCR
jgi:hypothetical protein